MAVARVPWLPVVVCALLAAAPSAVVALEPAPTNVATLGEVEATSDTVKWVLKIPPARRGHAMAYDSARGRVVLCGGEPNIGASTADTWDWDGNTWVQKTPAVSPSPRAGHAMAYDSARRRLMLFGGYGDDWEEEESYFADTWVSDGNTWVKRAPGTSPHRRRGHAMAYDSARGRVVLFGGYYADWQGHFQFFADTWEWDGDTWVQKTPATSPPARYNLAMAYDSARGRVVLFGGYSYDGTGHRLADTWEWDGDTWAQRTPETSPPARDRHALAYDAARQRVVLFGGWTDPALRLADTWEWDGDSWIQRTPGMSPLSRANHAMAYDSARGRVVLFGGEGFGGVFLADAWEWDGNTWVQRAASPSSRTGHAMAYDSARGRVVLFGVRLLACRRHLGMGRELLGR